MIFNADWRKAYRLYIEPRLYVAHTDFAGLAAKLRDAVNVEIWTESPSDATKIGAGKTSYSLEGWRVFYTAERANFVAYNAANAALLQAFDSQAKTALDGYVASLGSIGVVMNNILANYRDGTGNLISKLVSQADRNTLATAIEAELQ